MGQQCSNANPCLGGKTEDEKSHRLDSSEFISRKLFEQTKERHREEKLLLRYKTEVLVNLLAVGERKIESLTKRNDVLKYALLSQDVGEARISELLKDVVTSGEDEAYKSSAVSGGSLTSFSFAAVDLKGAIERLTTEFAQCGPDIVAAFADDEGRLQSALSRDEFMRQLFAATEGITKADVHLIAFRFFDGDAVSVTEFLDFFLSPSSVRQAKSAASAVRMSLELLQLSQTLTVLPQASEGSRSSPSRLSVSHRTDFLDKSVQSLLSIWQHVKESLKEELLAAERLDGQQVVAVQAFKSALLSVCGDQSRVLEKCKAEPRLTKQDVDILADRFEICGRVHISYFLQFFNETSDRLASESGTVGTDGLKRSPFKGKPVPHLGMSPFRLSSEWAVLKATHAIVPIGGDELPPPVTAEKRPRPQPRESATATSLSLHPPPPSSTPAAESAAPPLTSKSVNDVKLSSGPAPRAEAPSGPAHPGQQRFRSPSVSSAAEAPLPGIKPATRSPSTAPSRAPQELSAPAKEGSARTPAGDGSSRRGSVESTLGAGGGAGAATATGSHVVVEKSAKSTGVSSKPAQARPVAAEPKDPMSSASLLASSGEKSTPAANVDEKGGANAGGPRGGDAAKGTVDALSRESDEKPTGHLGSGRVEGKGAGRGAPVAGAAGTPASWSRKDGKDVERQDAKGQVKSPSAEAGAGGPMPDRHAKAPAKDGDGDGGTGGADEEAAPGVVNVNVGTSWASRFLSAGQSLRRRVMRPAPAPAPPSTPPPETEASPAPATTEAPSAPAPAPAVTSEAAGESVKPSAADGSTTSPAKPRSFFSFMRRS